MADSERYAITAIRDMHQEGFIAAALMRLGWKVIYRATSPQGLREFVTNASEALIVQSDDFDQSADYGAGQVIFIRGRSFALMQQSVNNPANDFQLDELLREVKSQSLEKPFFIPATSTPILSVVSAGRHVGNTSLAINFADVLARKGRKVLLVDGNISSPSLARHFSLHNIQSAPQLLHQGFSIFEVSDIGGLIYINLVASQYDAIVVDEGEAQPIYPSGHRIGDQLSLWITHSRARRILCLRNDAQSLERLQGCAAQYDPHSIIVLPTKVVGRRERRNIEATLSSRFGTPTHLLSRENRVMEDMQTRGTTLAHCAPKSIVLGEITRILEVVMG